MKILVTGGAGFIGSHTVDALLEAGHEVRALDSLDPQVHPGGDPPDHLNAAAEWRWGDVRDPEAVDSALDGVDAVLHLAAAVGVGQSMYQIRHYVDVNAMGAATVLEALANRSDRVERLVVASSMSGYGEGAYRCGEHGEVRVSARPLEKLRAREWEPTCPVCDGAVEAIPTAESHGFAPTSVYAVTKRDHEELFLSVGAAYEVPTVALRYFNVYGSRQSLSNPYTGVMAIFASRMLNGQPPVIFEDGRQTRDFVHVSDIVQANLLALTRPVPSGVYNVGTGVPTSVAELAETLADAIGFERPPVVDDRFRMGDIRHCYADIGRIRSDLGYAPRVELGEGVERLTAWLERQTAVDRVAQATAELEERGLLR